MPVVESSCTVCHLYLRRFPTRGGACYMHFWQSSRILSSRMRLRPHFLLRCHQKVIHPFRLPWMHWHYTRWDWYESHRVLTKAALLSIYSRYTRLIDLLLLLGCGIYSAMTGTRTIVLHGMVPLYMIIPRACKWTTRPIVLQDPIARPYLRGSFTKKSTKGGRSQTFMN